MPPLSGRLGSLDHVLGDAGLRDLKAELEQLAMDAWRPPLRVIHAHLPDQRAQVCADLRPPSLRSRFPAPIPAETGTMPTHEGLGPNDGDRFQDRWKPSIQLDEKQPIAISELDSTLHLPPQYSQLMPERGVLRVKSALRLERRGEQRKQEAQQRDHRRRP
jgi:hypothetical protein